MRARALTGLFHIYTAADGNNQAEDAALGTSQLKIGLGNWGYREDAKSSKYRSPWPKGAPASPQALSVLKQLQTKAEAPASAPATQTQLSTGEVINISKQDDQGTKCTLTACRIEDIEDTPRARFRDLHFPLWFVNADLLVDYDSAGFIPKWLFDVMMLGNDLIFYGDTYVVYRIGRDIQRLCRTEKDKDPTTVPLYHARLPVFSSMSGSVTTNMYQFDEHTRTPRGGYHLAQPGGPPGRKGV